MLLVRILKNDVQFLALIYKFMSELRKNRYIALLLLTRTIEIATWL